MSLVDVNAILMGKAPFLHQSNREHNNKKPSMKDEVNFPTAALFLLRRL